MRSAGERGFGMNMRSWISKLGFATLLLGVIAMGTGCDAVDGMMAVARATATQSVTEAVTGVIGGTVDGILGNVIPGSGGA